MLTAQRKRLWRKDRKRRVDEHLRSTRAKGMGGGAASRSDLTFAGGVGSNSQSGRYDSAGSSGLYFCQSGSASAWTARGLRYRSVYSRDVVWGTARVSLSKAMIDETGLRRCRRAGIPLTTCHSTAW
jgi:hypothetical protein